jgi:tryptophan 2,3-dioxygenase
MQIPGGERSIAVVDQVDTPQDRAAIETALAAPSIYDATVAHMAHLPFTGIEPRHDYISPYQRSEAVFAAWRHVYEDREQFPELYQLGEKLIDLEDAFRRWRFAHLATVSRVIGINPGTGGSMGLQYLKSAANQLIESPLYPELGSAERHVQPRSDGGVIPSRSSIGSNER